MAERPALASVSSSSFQKGRVPHFRVLVGLDWDYGRVYHMCACVCVGSCGGALVCVTSQHDECFSLCVCVWRA